jgi:peptidoglycan/xylan/chitin deacetylase (PgdA/CDA1 family)
MLKLAKRGALYLLNGSGVSRLVRGSAWRGSRLLILCYHGISLADEHEWDSSLYMSPSDFDGRLRSIQRSGCAVLPLGDALEQLFANNLREPTVALTFDDGLYDFSQRAYPRLERYGYPATVYLTTYYSEHQQPVFPSYCSYLLWQGRGTVLDAAGITGAREQWNLASGTVRTRALGAIITFAEQERLSAEEKTALARTIAERLGVDHQALVAKRILHLLNAREVGELAAKGVDFQLHTHRHYTPPDRALFLREIRDNRERIRGMTGVEPTHFCYPSGVHGPECLRWLADAGVISATTTEPGLASSRAHPLLLPRLVDTGNVTSAEFEAWLDGVGALLPRRPLEAATLAPNERLRVANKLADAALRVDSRVAGRLHEQSSSSQSGRGPVSPELR